MTIQHPAETYFGHPVRYADVARLFEFDFHYQVGKLGTATEIPE